MTTGKIVVLTIWTFVSKVMSLLYNMLPRLDIAFITICSNKTKNINTGVGCHFLLQGNLPDPGIKPGSPTLQADALPSEPPGKP